jgi:hypothetical protein
MRSQDISKDLIFKTAYDIATKDSDNITQSQIFKRTLFYYHHFCVCLNIDVSINDKHLKSMYNGEIKDEFGVTPHE